MSIVGDGTGGDAGTCLRNGGVALDGLLATIAPPPPTVEWTFALRIPPSVRGTRCYGGDMWAKALLDGQVIYRSSTLAGNVPVYWGTSEQVVEWCRTYWDLVVANVGEVQAARGVLLATVTLPHEDGYDLSAETQIVEVFGLDFFVKHAGVAEWLIPNVPDESSQVQWYRETCWTYDLPCALLTHVCDAANVPAIQIADLPWDSIWEHPESRQLYYLMKSTPLVDGELKPLGVTLEDVSR
ncbi:MAG: hypothetical protein ABI670_20995 [Chloroflexota bacterium]